MRGQGGRGRSHPGRGDDLDGRSVDAVSCDDSSSIDERSLVASRLAELIGLHRRGVTNLILRGAQYDAGLAWVWFPPGCGGLGVAPALQDMVDRVRSEERRGGKEGRSRGSPGQ